MSAIMSPEKRRKTAVLRECVVMSRKSAIMSPSRGQNGTFAGCCKCWVAVLPLCPHVAKGQGHNGVFSTLCPQVLT